MVEVDERELKFFCRVLQERDPIWGDNYVCRLIVEKIQDALYVYKLNGVNQ